LRHGTLLLSPIEAALIMFLCATTAACRKAPKMQSLLGASISCHCSRRVSGGLHPASLRESAAHIRMDPDENGEFCDCSGNESGIEEDFVYSENGEGEWHTSCLYCKFQRRPPTVKKAPEGEKVKEELPIASQPAPSGSPPATEDSLWDGTPTDEEILLALEQYEKSLLVVSPTTPPLDPNEEDSIWNGMTDEEMLLVYEDYQKKQSGAAVSTAPKRNTFEQLHEPTISSALFFEWSQKGYAVSFSNLGFFSLFFDLDKVDAAWQMLSHLYLARQLFGIYKMARANAELRPGNGIVILIFTGPTKEKDFVLDVGRKVVLQLQYTKQRCSKNYPRALYFKKGKKALLFENGPFCYKLPY
jgi:hypothetical protein